MSNSDVVFPGHALIFLQSSVRPYVARNVSLEALAESDFHAEYNFGGVLLPFTMGRGVEWLVCIIVD